MKTNTYGEMFLMHLKLQLKEYFKEHENWIKEYSSFKEWTNIITKHKGGKSLIDKSLTFTFHDFDTLSVNDFSKIKSTKKYSEVKSANEYYHIDNILYKNILKDDEFEGKNMKYKQTGIKVHKWELLGAVEHENAWDDWSYEVVKLAYINCPLRVVVSYGNYDDGYKSAVEVANYIAQKCNLAKYINVDQEFLLIFGPRVKNLNNQILAHEMFKGFKFVNGEFIEMA